MVKGSKQKWIEKGCGILAKKGPDNIQVERPAGILKQNKSSFYHFLKKPENFINVLSGPHREVAKQMSIYIQQCKTPDPDYFKVVVKYKRSVLVQGQLDRKTNNTNHLIKRSFNPTTHEKNQI